MPAACKPADMLPGVPEPAEGLAEPPAWPGPSCYVQYTLVRCVEGERVVRVQYGYLPIVHEPSLVPRLEALLEENGCSSPDMTGGKAKTVAGHPDLVPG